jgi:acyl phosphate:glycerol-3-phosphate acyltransferase
MTSTIYILIAFLAGSLPFSVWIGKAMLRKDVRQFGDGNPGSTNVYRAGGRAAWALALMLDISKAAAPVGYCYFNLGFRGVEMYLIAVAPLFGHMFSPFLKFRGGKAVSVVLGIWIGLTLWKASLASVLGALVGFALFGVAGWAVMTGLAFVFVSLLLWMPEPLFFAVLLTQVLLMAWTHRTQLQSRPSLRRKRPDLKLAHDE